MVLEEVSHEVEAWTAQIRQLMPDPARGISITESEALRPRKASRAKVFLRLRRDLRDDREEKLPQALVVLVEHGHDLLVGDRLGALDARRRGR